MIICGAFSGGDFLDNQNGNNSGFVIKNGGLHTEGNETVMWSDSEFSLVLVTSSSNKMTYKWKSKLLMTVYAYIFMDEIFHDYNVGNLLHAHNELHSLWQEIKRMAGCYLEIL